MNAKTPALLVLTLIFALVMCGAASADEYVGGQPLTTVQNGTVSGGVYSDTYYGFDGPGVTGNNDAGTANITYSFQSLPSNAEVTNATLYVAVYAGHMQNDYTVNTNVVFNENILENSIDLQQPYNYIYDGGNDNTGQGGGTDDPYKIINNHTIRVTSDYLMKYDVTSLMQQNNIAQVSTVGSYDGRIKLISLIAAYNDGDSDQIKYWINQGQDVASYQQEDNFGNLYVGSTNFATNNITGIESAHLKVIHMASGNGLYGFPSDTQNFEIDGSTWPALITGGFTNVSLDNSSPDTQASYSGSDSWDVTSSVNGSDDVTLGYARNIAGTGTAGYWKIVMAILTAEIQNIQAPVADFSSNITNGVRPLQVNFNDLSTNNPTSWAWDFNNDGTVDSTDQNPSWIFDTAGTYTVKLTATNDGGSDDEIKTNYITVNPNINLNIGGLVNTVPASAVFAKEPNAIRLMNVQNQGTDTATNIVVHVYASDVSDTVPVAITTIDSLAGGARTNLDLIDPTIRDLEGGTIRYTAKLDPDNLIAETNEEDNIKASAPKQLKYNGYKGKRYWTDGNDITNKHVYNLNGDIIYFTQPVSAYKAVGWSDRTETWTAANLPIPEGATIEKALLFFSYNWDTTEGGYPKLITTFNGENITLGIPYLDWSNFGAYANYKYGLYPAVDVTNLFVKNGDNTLVTLPDIGNSNALYPSTLAVIYSDISKTRKVIYINEECDELGLSESSYATTPEEATAYAIFNNINITNLLNATLHSFSGSAGPDEGNLLWNGVLILNDAWQGTASTASALVTNVTSHLKTNNEVGIQSTSSGGMLAIQQFLVLEYGDVGGADLIVTAIKANVGAGEFMFANEPNVISVTVENNGTVASLATTVDVDVNGTIYTTNVPALDAGASTTITVTDTASHTGGSSVPINANTNPDRNIPETNTSNNTLNINLTVYNNGYKGKQYTDDDEYNSIDTKQTFDGKYDVIYSNGDAAYRGSGATWANPYTASWTSTDLPIPAGATVESARLYQGYTWNTLGGIPDFIASFNGNTLTALAHYSDTKGYGTSNYPSGLLVYDVTSFFNTAGNTLTLTNGTTTGATTALYGSYLIVVFQDPNTTNKKIYINDGADLLCSRETFSVNDTEGTANAKFNDVNTANLGNAQVIAILASANEKDKSKFFFNEQEYTGFWSAYLEDPQIGFSVYDVTSATINGQNVAGLQSYDPTPGNITTYGDSMFAMGSILITTFKLETHLTVPDKVGVNNETVNLTSTLTDINSNTLIGREVTFQVNGSTVGTAATDSNGVATLAYIITQTPGTYTIKTIFNEDNEYQGTTSNGTLTVDKNTTNLVVTDISGINGQNIDLVATLTSNGLAIKGKTIQFTVNGTNIGSTTTNANGVATIAYTITQNMGNYEMAVIFTGDSEYLNSDGSGVLTVDPSAGLYLNVTVSNANPTVGETFIITYKLGNYGPDPAKNVTTNFQILEGLEFVSISVDSGTWNYDPTTRTVNWTLDNVPVGDPYLYLTVKALQSGQFLIAPDITSDTYNWNTNIPTLTINIKQPSTDDKDQPSTDDKDQPSTDDKDPENAAKATTKTVPMQKTGTPIHYLLLVFLMIGSGLLMSKRKK